MRLQVTFANEWWDRHIIVSGWGDEVPHVEAMRAHVLYLLGRKLSSKFRYYGAKELFTQKDPTSFKDYASFSVTVFGPKKRLRVLVKFIEKALGYYEELGRRKKKA